MAATIRKAFHDAPEGQLFYRYILTSAPDKKAPVVFLHQSASCGWVYETIMKQYAERGHDCYAPDMPGFGGSYDPVENPSSTRYYVDVYVHFIRSLKAPKVHLVGHHAGAGMGMELAAVYPDELLTVALSAPALATREEQDSMFKTIAGELSKPKEDGSHFMKVWDVIEGELIPDIETKNHEVLDTLRAWKGRDQAYGVLFKQDKIGYFKTITIPVLAMCSKQDVLWPCFRYCKELLPNARCEVTTGNFFKDTKEVEGSVAFHHMDFLDKLGY